CCLYLTLRMPSHFGTAVRIFITTLFAAVVLFAILLAYVTGYQFIHTEQHHLSFGLYGAFLSLHLLLQSLFAFLEHRQMRGPSRPQHLRRTVALCIAAYQEDPDYLRKCLRSIRRISFPGLKVVLVVDGNRQEDAYMMDIFQEVMGGVEQTGCVVWKGNYHSDGDGGGGKGSLHAEEAARVARVVRSSRYSCIIQEWGGKREVMYTAFKALGDTVDYIQVCDSDTVLDPACTIEMLKVLEEDPEVGGVGGDVQVRILPILVIFMSPSTTEKFSSNFGYKTKFTARSQCQTETPTQYLRWLNQQTRWSKSYFREWLYNALWFHKHSLWMTYESVVTGIFPFFLVATVIHLFYPGRLWNILLFLLTVQLVGMVKATYACFLRGRLVMIFMSLYSLLYMSSLLPAKIFALFTINKAGWGTSGRKKIVVNLIGAVPVTMWAAILLGGVVYTIYCEVQEPFSETEKALLIAGTILYACYWLILLVLYLAIVAKRCNKREEQYHLSYAEA
uniref:Hyaluronan synthase 3 n=1 Tax=Cyprinus carpio TaxID=7962 RepID=A0A8C2K527_CYPCA